MVSCVMLVTAHSSAVTVAEEQPTKLACHDGEVMYDSEVPPSVRVGFGLTRENQKVHHPVLHPGGTRLPCNRHLGTPEYEGLNQLARFRRVRCSRSRNRAGELRVPGRTHLSGLHVQKPHHAPTVIRRRIARCAAVRSRT